MYNPLDLPHSQVFDVLREPAGCVCRSGFPKWSRDHKVQWTVGWQLLLKPGCRAVQCEERPELLRPGYIALSWRKRPLTPRLYPDFGHESLLEERRLESHLEARVKWSGWGKKGRYWCEQIRGSKPCLFRVKINSLWSRGFGLAVESLCCVRS